MTNTFFLPFMNKCFCKVDVFICREISKISTSYNIANFAYGKTICNIKISLCGNSLLINFM